MDKVQFDKWLDKFSWPDGLQSNTLYERKEDMSPDGYLGVIIQDDGDGIVSLLPSDPDAKSVEFCTCGMGGGKSPRVLKAIRILATAIMLDNKD